MQKWLRRIRGSIGMGFSWAIAWAIAGSVPRWILGINADVPFPLVFGVVGFIAGVTFSWLLVLTEGGRKFDQIRLSRFAVWGAIGGAVVSVLFGRAASLGWGDVLMLAPTLAVASAVCASGSFALARRGQPLELTDASRETGAVANHEKQKALLR